MSQPARPFTHSDEVRFSDLDVMGHLNNVAFLVFFESARVAYARSVMPEHNPGSAGEFGFMVVEAKITYRSPGCLLYTSPSPRDVEESRMPSSA